MLNYQIAAVPRRNRVRGLAMELLRQRFPDSPDPRREWLPPKPDWKTGLPDLDVLEEELERVRERRGKIVLYGHDDMDGITGLFVGLRVLRREGFHVVPILPRREFEDYGLLPERMAPHLSRGDLLLTVDYGCSAVKGVRWARDAGARVVITDHHTLNPPLPDAHGLVDPQVYGASATATVLAGCGVLYAALCSIWPKWEDDDQLLAAVALGTVSDRVPLLGWNRALLHMAGQIRRQALTAGLRVMMDAWPGDGYVWSGGMVRHAITSTVGKGNGSGIDQMLDFMFSQDEPSCRKAWIEMRQHSDQRAHVLSSLVKDAMKRKDDQADAYGMILVKMPEIPSGMGGTLASKLSKIYRRGAIVVSRREDGALVGEARSPGDWNMAGFLVSLKEHFTSAGGHVKAAGFTYAGTSWEELRDVLISHMPEYPTSPVPRPHVDMELPSQPDPSEFVCLAPFGPDFPPPALKIDGMRHLLNVSGEPGWCITEDSGE